MEDGQGSSQESDPGQAGAVIERRGADEGDAVADPGAGQVGAASERIVPDAGDAVGDRDAGQAGAAKERRVPDAGDAVGMVTLVRLTHLENALAPMLVTGRLLIVPGMVTAPPRPW